MTPLVLARRIVLVVALACCSLVMPTAEVRAVAPSNDNFATASDIVALPFSETVDMADATLEPGEPFPCAFTSGSTWYRIHATDAEVLRLTLSGPMFQLWADVFRDTGSGMAGLVHTVGCLTPGSSATITAAAGETYYVQLNRSTSGPLFPPATVDTTRLEAPVNDNVTNATPIVTLPATTSVDTTAATIEP